MDALTGTIHGPDLVLIVLLIRFLSMTDKTLPSIAIIGAGASGVACTVQLILKQAISKAAQPFRILLFDKTDFGPGLAYGTGEEAHLLNTRASLMGIMPGEPMHFVEWMKEHEQEIRVNFPGKEFGADSYPPRTLFGQYLRQTLAEYLELGQLIGIEVETIREEVSDAIISGERVALIMKDADGHRGDHLADSDSSHKVDYVILATGNPLPAAFPQLKDKPGYLPSPWPSGNLLSVVDRRDASVGIIGTSLTAVDTVFSLIENGHTGPIFLVSLDGLLPRVQSPREKEYDRSVFTLERIHRLMREERRAPRVIDAIRLFRAEVEQALDKKPDWRKEEREGRDTIELLREDLVQAEEQTSIFQNILYSMRFDFYAIWQLLEPDEKMRYLKWIKAFVDINRHAMPFENGKKLLKLLEQGTLKVIGQSKDMLHDGDHFVLKTANGTEQSVDYLINASGPETDVEEMRDIPLLNRLTKKGYLHKHAAGGITADLRTMRINALDKKAGAASSSPFYAIGHPLAGQQLDINAVWFNVRQADLLTTDLLKRMEEWK